MLHYFPVDGQVRATEKASAEGQTGLLGSIGGVLAAGRAARTGAAGAHEQEEISAQAWRWTQPKEARTVFEAIVYVLRTGCQWKALPKERFGSASAIHKRFLEWESAGFFRVLWQAGLAEYDDMEGIAWRWQSVDGALVKAPLAQESVGPNPTDRGKNGSKRMLLVDGVASRCRSS